MMKKTIASLLALSIAGTGIMAVYAEENTAATEVSPRYVNLSSYLDADMIAKTGDTVGENWIGGEEITNGNFNGISGSALPEDGYIDCYKRIPTTEQLAAADSTNWSAVTKSATDYVTAYINPENYSGGVNDAIHIPGNGDSVTVNLSGEFSENVYVFMQGTASYNRFSYTLNYEDGTNENKSDVNSWAYQYAMYNKISNNPDLVAFSNTYKRIGYNLDAKSSTDAEKADDNVFAEGSSIGMMYVVGIDTKSTKKVKSVTFNVTATDASEHGFFVYAITEEPVGNETLTSYIGETLKITDINTTEDREKVNLSLEYAAILSKRGDANATQYIASLNKLIKKSESDNTKYLDLSDYMDADLIGLNGEYVGDNWLGGLSATSNFAGIVGDNLPTDGYIKSYIYTPGTDTTENWNTATKSTTDYVTAYINPDRYAANINDAVYIPGDRSDVKINLSGGINEKIYVFMQGSSSYNKMAYTLTYSDGTTKTESDTNSATAQNILYNKISDTPRAVAFSENYKRAVVENSKITEGDSVKMMYALSLDVDNTKKAESLTLKVYNENNDQGYFVYAITEEPVKNEVLSSYIDTVSEKNIITSDDKAKLEKALFYAEELDARGVVTYEESTTTLAKQIKQYNAQGNRFIDISENYNFDVIGTIGDAVAEDYTNGYEVNNFFGVMKAEKLPTDGMLSIGKVDVESLEDVTQNWNSVMGTTNGTVTAKFDTDTYAGGKDDSVLVDKEYAFNLGNNYTDDLYVFMGTTGANGANMSYRIDYTDGTSTVVDGQKVTNYQSTRYSKVNDFYYVTALTGGYGNNLVRGEDGKLVAGSTSSNSGIYAVALGIASDKVAKSVTFKPSTGKDAYFILAVTAEAKTFEELQEDMKACTVTGISDITILNAPTVIDAADAAIRLDAADAGFEVDVEKWNDMKLAAQMVMNGEEVSNILKYTPVITIDENKNAVANVEMMNTTADDDNYVLIIAAYGENNKLLGAVIGDDKVLSKDTISSKDSISMQAVNGVVKYKVFVWENLNTIEPIAFAEEEVK